MRAGCMFQSQGWYQSGLQLWFQSNFLSINVGSSGSSIYYAHV
jgi:hypothetical protein